MGTALRNGQELNFIDMDETVIVLIDNNGIVKHYEVPHDLNLVIFNQDSGQITASRADTLKEDVFKYFSNFPDVAMPVNKMTIK